MKIIGKALVLIIVGLMILLPLASTHPDGLEKVAESLGVSEPNPLWEGLMPDYTFHLVENSYLTKLVSGLTGLLLVILTTYGIGIILSRKSDNHQVAEDS